MFTQQHQQPMHRAYETDVAIAKGLGLTIGSA
jgi:hypothetical protein